MLTVTPIPAFNDNYIWLLQRPDTQRAVVVDPGQSEPVMTYLKKHGLTLEAILITHHHHDHIGGIEKLLAENKVPVYGPNNPAIPHIDTPLTGGDKISILGETFAVLEVPGHTLDHIAYISHNTSKPLLFCGDSLFSCGCGRLFEGSAEQMYASLQKYTLLAEDTVIYPTHEYTLANVDFALAVEPDNQQLYSYQVKCQQLRDTGQPTLPTTLKEQLAINPFLRSDKNSIRDNVSKHFQQSLTRPVDVFRQTRLWKDQF